MNKRLFAHLPWIHVEKYLDFILQKDLQPEFAFSGPALDRLCPESLEKVGHRIQKEGRKIIIHGPFHDLNPGALDPLVQEITAYRVRQTLHAAHRLGSSLVVFHPGFEKWKYGLDYHPWLEKSLEFWPPLLELAAGWGIRIVLENIFENSPDSIVHLVEELNNPFMGYCFDVGHWNLFSGEHLKRWISQFGPRLFHLHLHDNFGTADQHLPVGEGEIPFTTLFEELEGIAQLPSMTLEAHDPSALLRSLEAVTPFLR